MKKNNENNQNRKAPATLTTLCVEWCRKLVAQIQNAKDQIIAEYSVTLGAHEHLLRLALNEAEALAWETEFPQLIFPTLAVEKADEVAAWHTRQRAIERGSRAEALAV